MLDRELCYSILHVCWNMYPRVSLFDYNLITLCIESFTFPHGTCIVSTVSVTNVESLFIRRNMEICYLVSSKSFAGFKF